MQNVVFSSEKGLNGPKHFSDSQHSIKISPNKIFHTSHWWGFPQPLNAITETLRCLQLIYTYRRTGVIKCLHLHTKGRGGVKFWMIFSVFCIHTRLNYHYEAWIYKKKKKKKMKNIQESCLKRTCRLKMPANPSL